MANENPISFLVLVDNARYERFFKASKDANPLHMDLEFARQHGFPERVLFGFDLVIEILSRLPQQTKSFRAQFMKPIFPGEKISVLPLGESHWIFEDDDGLARTKIWIESEPFPRDEKTWSKQKNQIWELSQRAGSDPGALIIEAKLDWANLEGRSWENSYLNGRAKEIQVGGPGYQHWLRVFKATPVSKPGELPSQAESLQAKD